MEGGTGPGFPGFRIRRPAAFRPTVLGRLGWGDSGDSVGEGDRGGYSSTIRQGGPFSCWPGGRLASYWRRASATSDANSPRSAASPSCASAASDAGSFAQSLGAAELGKRSCSIWGILGPGAFRVSGGTGCGTGVGFGGGRMFG